MNTDGLSNSLKLSGGSCLAGGVACFSLCLPRFAGRWHFRDCSEHWLGAFCLKGLDLFFHKIINPLFSCELSYVTQILRKILILEYGPN